MGQETPLVSITTLPEALAQLDAWIVAYDRLAETHAETLRKLEIERMLAEDFAYWWKQQQD